MTGGLKCGDVFCPFATAPIVPCCTEAEDVESGTARIEGLCGLDFSATGSDFYGDHCWQRDQPGVVDDTCPNVNVDLATSEPGCCDDHGKCGGVDMEHGLGCHADSYAEERKSCGAGPVDPEEPMCDATGRFAMRMEVDMAWGGRSGGLWDLTDDGRGDLVLQLLVDIEKIDAESLELTGTAHACGVQLPPFYSTTLCEAYQPVFPTRIWESEEMPTFPITGRMQCLREGCIATIDAQTVLLGMELDNPESPWPNANQTRQLECASGEGAACFPDHDDDGKPGVTVVLESGGQLSGGTGCRSRYTKRSAPLSSSAAAIFNGVRRTDRLQLGVRMKVGGSITFGAECGGGSGLGVAEFVNSRAWGCMVQQGTVQWPSNMPAGPNDPCTPQQATFLDANLPIYDILSVGETPSSMLDLKNETASPGTRVKLVRLGAGDDAVSCQAVRDAVFP